MALRSWTVFALVSIALAAGALWYISRIPCFQITGEFICRVETDRKIVALTFDDGPTPEGVGAILPILERKNVKATFFLIGKEIKRHPGLLEQIHQAGHEIGNHTYHHSRNIARSQAYYEREIADTDRLFEAAGVSSKLFRPPYGKRLFGLQFAVWKSGYKMVTWDVSANPGKAATPKEHAENLISLVKPGSIILMHPMYPANEIELQAVPLVIEGLRQRGYEIATVGAMLEEVR